jgi:tetratricopeptide (TPR) repeat protein
MEKKEIRKEAKNYFSKKEYQKAIQTIWKLGLDDFVAFGLKERWFNNIDLLDEICKSSNIFHSCFEFYRSDEVLHQYFNSQHHFKKIEQKIASEYPELFIKTVRANQAFIKTDKLDFLLSIDFAEKYKVHQNVWRHLANIDTQLWNTIDKKLKELSNNNFSEILTETIIWLENKRFEHQELFQNQHLSSVYSFFIKLFLQKHSNEYKKINSEEFFKRFYSKLGKQTNNTLSELLDLISQWVQFNDSILSAYSFDMDIQPSVENGVLYFNRQPKDYYKWKLDGVRYNLNRLSYFFKGIDCVEYLADKEGMQIPKGSKPKDEEGNYQLAVQQWQLTTFLDDLKLDSFVFQGREIKSQLLFQPLLTYSKNKNIRYEQELQKHFDSSNNWTDAFVKLTKEAFQNNFLENNPYFLMSKEEYINLNNTTLQELHKNSSEEIINLFSYFVNPNYDFNRFNVGYNVWQKPFVQLGDYLFCPMMFFANNDWFYGFAQAGLENLAAKKNGRKISTNYKEEQRTTSLFEKELCNKLKNKGWKITEDINIGRLTKGKESGDIDILIKDEQTTLFLQLKRTKFRLNLKEAYNEAINTDRKASRQLNDAEKFLTKDSDIIEINNKVHKWIVTTSFEGILSEIDSCLKINYFDLLQAISNLDIKSLEQLISYIENDSGIKNWLQFINSQETPNELKFGILEAGLPLQLSEPKMYRQVLFSDDNCFVEYHSKYNKALELDNKGNKDKAIEILELCLKENSEDYEVWSALGNIYADKRDFRKSFKCFERALEIIPNDPFIFRNYALANRDSGNFERTLEMYDKIQKQYWFLDLR